MQNIIVIGTLHAGLTPNNDLRDIFDKHSPTQILVEISQDDINKNNIDYNGRIKLDTKFTKMRGNDKMKIYDKTIKDF